jgi:UDP-N-acetylmuramoyl-tripeptide--D-alanyl-D-alanine ligase
LAGLNAKRKIYVTPGLVEMGVRTVGVHREMGAQLAKVADLVVLVRNSVTPYIEEGLRQNRYQGEVLWYKDAPSCLAALPVISKPGDVFLLQNDWPDNYA